MQNQVWFSSQMRQFRGNCQLHYSTQISHVNRGDSVWSHSNVASEWRDVLNREHALVQGHCWKKGRQILILYSPAHKRAEVSHKAILQEENNWCSQLLPSKFVSFLVVSSVITFIKQCQCSHSSYPCPFCSLFFPLTYFGHFLSDIFSFSGFWESSHTCPFR